MSKIIQNLIAVFVLIITISVPVMAQAPELTWEQKVSNMSVKEMIDYIAPQYNQDAKLINKISYCESRHQLNVVHDGGYGKGVTGIHRATFDGWNIMFEKEFGFKLNYDSPFDQLTMMSYVFEKGDSYRNQWTTYVAYVNGGIYFFYSNLLKNYFTVRCA